MTPVDPSDIPCTVCGSPMSELEVDIGHRCSWPVSLVPVGLGYDVSHIDRGVLAHIYRRRSGASQWVIGFVVRGDSQRVKERTWPSLTHALQYVISINCLDANAAEVVDRMMIERGKAAPRRRS